MAYLDEVLFEDVGHDRFFKNQPGRSTYPGLALRLLKTYQKTFSKESREVKTTRLY
jgi:hypothetical protein